MTHNDTTIPPTGSLDRQVKDQEISRVKDIICYSLVGFGVLLTIGWAGLLVRLAGILISSLL
jgi:hypothetical protein